MKRAPSLVAFRAIALAFLLLGPVATAAQEAKVVVIGFVVAYDAQIADCIQRRCPPAFLQVLRDAGWIEGRNLQVVRRSVEGCSKQRGCPALEELAQMPVDVLVTGLNGTARWMARRSPKIPIVVATADYPVEDGLVSSLSRPGGSITGVSNWVGRSLDAKRLELLKETVPGLTRVAFLGPEWMASWPETRAAAEALGLTIVWVDIDQSRITSFESGFDRALRAGAQAIFVPDFPLAFVKEARLMVGELGVKHRLPVMQTYPWAADAGSLLAYGPNTAENFRRAGNLVVKILRGAKPAELPFEQPTSLELVVNLQTARAIGLTVPPSVLIQASRVID